jgi:Xaa-Pro aminopeptidase
VTAEHRQRLIASRSLPSDGAYVSADLPTVRYLTGFSGSSATVVVEGPRVVLITDGRYRDQAAAECAGIEVVIQRDVVVALEEVLTGRSLHLDERANLGLLAGLQAAGFTVHPMRDPVMALREIKDDGELQHLHAACSITATALAQEIAGVRVGDREVDIARSLEARFGELGAEDRAFPTIVAGGPNSAVPHHRASSRPLQPGDLLVIDCGAMVGGYHADMTRTFVVGAEPADWQREVHEIVLGAQERARNVVTPGIRAREVDLAARSFIEQRGYAANFTHGTGHGVGLQIHESPMLSASTDECLGERFVVTVEPGVYLPGRGGVRIEDTVVVADPSQVLTPMDRALTRVG